jgi:hypothetical protein
VVRHAESGAVCLFKRSVEGAFIEEQDFAQFIAVLVEGRAELVESLELVDWLDAATGWRMRSMRRTGTSL